LDDGSPSLTRWDYLENLMTRRLLDTVRGTGTIHASGELIRKTTYEISIWSGGSPKDDDHPGTLPNIDGHIDITGMAEAIVLAGPAPSR